MDQILLIIVGILGVSVSLVVKLIFLCMGADPQQQQQQQPATATHPKPCRRHRPATRRRT